MTDKQEVLKKIVNAISNITSEKLFESSLDLFKTLGYNIIRQNRLDNPTFAEFKRTYLENNSKFKEKAQTDNWQKIEILFQLTDAEMNDRATLFGAGKFDNAEIYSYLFIAIELKSGNYNRTALSDITRQVNRVFSMPVMLMFKHDNNITFSIIKRRLNKKDESRDVLEKVTLIKDIDIINPHRAHIEILFDLSLEELRKEQTITNFVELQKALEKTLDSSELNKKFYKEIANWYFWAVEHVEFPDDLEKNRGIRNATATIRLLTRLIFVWFIKEKSVIPGELFRKDKLKQILKNFDTPETSDTTIFYKAILQNLFFATLSTEKDKRKFREKGWKNGRNLDFGNQYVYRYENLVADIDKWKSLFADIPFLNGGLFENLDNKTKRIMVDGFSEEMRNSLKVPDSLFFVKEHTVDLNKTFDTKGKTYKVKGLLEILNLYKFTVAENTPIEEEIALDPELLGKVFENLLASFNPETQTTARKQTGSFYTPREIVNYMVDESLKVSISNLVSQSLTNTTPDDIKTGLDILFAYTEKEHAFTNTEVTEIIKTISKIKILDPACGSGAFPMGILHKLTFILNKLDPTNIVWRKLQKEKAIKDTETAYNLGEKYERQHRIKEIEETFDFNTSDYGRKLFLIENAIYGVDIQPIAVQISKLRFFISLIVDQDMKNNIKPLPNLETKFVAANTLIGRVKLAGQGELFDSPKIKELEEKLKIVRHNHFNARNPKIKQNIRKHDKRIREQIADKLDELVAKNREEDINKLQVKIEQEEKVLKEIENLPEDLKIIESVDIFGNKEQIKINKKKEKIKIQRTEIRLLKKELNDLQSTENSTIKVFGRQIASFDPYDQNHSADFFDMEWMFGITDGFDIVIANPPYIKEYVNRSAFDGLRNGPYYMGKMDIWYIFACKGIDLLNNQGALCFIAQNNWVTSYGAKKMRNKVLSDSKILQLLDFGDYKIFENTGIQTMVMLFQKVRNPSGYKLDFRRLNFNNKASFSDVLDLLSKNENEQVEYLMPDIDNDSLIGKPILFSNDKAEIILNKMIEKSNLKLVENEATNGIHSHHDIVNKSRKMILGNNFKVGQGIFVLSDDEKKSIPFTENELKLIKPEYTTKELFKYYANPKNRYWVIYTDSSFKNQNKIEEYPNIKKHLNKFQKVITSDNKPYGLHRARDEKFFKGEKIVSVRKCAKPTFTYTDFNCYVSATFYVIKSQRINIKFLTAILNSKLIAFWLRHKGKMQGNNFQIDKEPLLNIPLVKPEKDKQSPIINLVEKLLTNKESNKSTDNEEQKIDQLVYELYDLTSEEIAIIEGEKKQTHKKD